MALVAEELNHHPDIDIRWRTLTFRASTHDAGGRVTAMDVTLTKRINEMVRAADGGPGRGLRPAPRRP